MRRQLGQLLSLTGLRLVFFVYRTMCPMAQPPDPEVVAHTVRRAVESQRQVLAGLSDDRLRVVWARLLIDGDDPVTIARLDVVDRELRRRLEIAGRGREDATP
jgi:hypothetical protein